MGIVARASTTGGWTVLESSSLQAEAIRADASERFGTGLVDVRVDEGFVWDLAPRSARRIVIAPEAERGNALVHALVLGAARATTSEGMTYLLLDKRRGGDRSLDWSRTLWREVQVIQRRGPHRLARLRGPVDAPTWNAVAASVGFEGWAFDAADADGVTSSQPWRRFAVPWGEAWSLPGCYAGSALDPGTERLLDTLDREAVDVAGATVLDLGCGAGPLAGWAAARGATVTAVDDDLAAVRSTRRNVPVASVLHADMDGAWARPGSFDVVLVNPPFHVGAGMRADVGKAMVVAATASAKPGGSTWCVAHASLDVTAALGPAVRATKVASDERFVVWRFDATARRRPSQPGRWPA